MSGNAEIDARRPGDEGWWILREARRSVWLDVTGFVHGRRGSNRSCLTSKGCSCIRGLKGCLEAFCRSLVPGDVWVRIEAVGCAATGSVGVNAQHFVPHSIS